MSELIKKKPQPKIKSEPIVPRQIAKPRAETPRISDLERYDIESLCRKIEVVYHHDRRGFPPDDEWVKRIRRVRKLLERI
jgi:hypothetical protein